MQYIDCEDNIVDAAASNFVGWDGETRSTAWLADPLFCYEMGLSPYKQGNQLDYTKASNIVIEEGLCEVIWRYANDTWLLELEDARDKLVSQVKERAGELLASTDWYFTRQIERAIPTPDEVVSARQVVHDRCDELQAALEAAATYTDLYAIDTAF